MTCSGTSPSRHIDCAGCDCSCHWNPPATFDEIADLMDGAA